MTTLPIRVELAHDAPERDTNPTADGGSLPADTPVYVVLTASESSRQTYPPGAPGAVALFGPVLTRVVPARSNAQVTDTLRRILADHPPPVAFPDLEPLQLIVPARVSCDTTARSCEVVYLSPYETLTGWATDLPPDVP